MRFLLITIRCGIQLPDFVNGISLLDWTLKSILSDGIGAYVWYFVAFTIISVV